MLLDGNGFDRIVIVDWSASSRPKLGRDSIWIAEDDGRCVTVDNLATRATAAAWLDAVVAGSTGERLLIGVDFSLGYPEGTASSLGLQGSPWRAMWRLLAASITDDECNRNNRFEVAADLNRRISAGAAPFWGCPPRHTGAWLRPTKPRDDVGHRLGEWRAVEHELYGVGRRPFSAWQLLGAGAVGSQSLVGIPVVERLRARHPKRVEVWPFTTGLELPVLGAGAVVIAEVWPALVEVDPGVHDVRDARQVEAVASWLRRTQDAGRIGALFGPQVASRSSEASIVQEVIIREEGWVIGAGGIVDMSDRTPGRHG